MKNQWRLYLSLFFAFVIIIFAILNNQSVSISFGFTAFSAPLILVIFGSAFIGALIVSLVVTSSYWRQTKEIKELKQQVTQLEKTIDEQVEARLQSRLTEEEQEVQDDNFHEPFSF